jgi:glutamate racemase
MLGIYDSGVGGLNILSEIIKQNPNVSFQYFADTKVLPLGDKSVGFIQNRVRLACEFLFKNGCDLVVLACNTASVNSIRYLQNDWLPKNFKGKQILSITKPLTEYLSEKYEHLKLEKGLLLSTLATHKSGFYQTEISKIGFTNLTSLPVQGLADAIEKNDSKKVDQILDELIISNQIEVDKMKYLVLACTHYKWATENIKLKFSEQLEIIDPSFYVSLKLSEYWQKYPKYQDFDGYQKYWVTGDKVEFERN